MKKRTELSIWYFVIAIALIFGAQWLFFSGTGNFREISYKEFKAKLAEQQIESIVIEPDRIIGEFKDGGSSLQDFKIGTGPSTPWRLRIKAIEEQMKRQFIVMRPPNIEDARLLEQLDAAGVNYFGKIEKNTVRDIFLNWVLPFIFIVALWGFLFRRMGHGSMLDLGRNKAKIQAEKPKNPVTFKDVAGVDEAVEEVREVVEFLKAPKKYTRLGGKLPKGLLLVGPPGTGKTLLAKAVAGEAGVPFFSISGSEFVEMFVGVGAARVRDLFNEAKNNAPCIIFIDEIDAIGKSRGGVTVVGGGYDERENTLNQLLVEMDGFDPGAGVIIMGATNRPDVLDPALLRPGRFDRQVLVDKPDMKGREAIFKVHTRSLKLASDADLHRLAAQTPGFAGAEIANVCNEAAILAVRNNRDAVTMQDFEAAIERVIAGLEKKNKLINERERKIVAYHESGHAIVGYFTPGADEVQKVSIVPRGFGALGYTLQMPLEDRYLMSKSELLGKIKGLLGGRAAEEIIFGDISTGAANDLEKVAQLARSMVTVYGMSEKLPNLSLVNRSGPRFLGEAIGVDRRSESMEQLIDEEVTTIIRQCYAEAKDLLLEKQELLEKMAQHLLVEEVLDYKEIQEILGPKEPLKMKNNTAELKTV
ncbi:MAG TPA: ATP-dependent zinc metalloprotease FtsH [Chitinophagales bacterium]|nr:ATP-dependent zinc metalloprotease FtsH [Chitinophagales bacterium]